MLAFIILWLLVIFWRSRPVPRSKRFYSDYMDPARTTAIKGVFILLIFLTHSEQYLTLSDTLPDQIYAIIRLGFGQSVVTAFFFYSGYGLMESLRRKGEPYLRAFPKARIFKTLLHFDLAVLLYLILDFVLDIPLTTGEIIGSLIGWESVGNSAWFIFDILVAYVMFYVCFRAFPEQTQWKKGALLFTVCSVVFVMLMILFRESRYYNTFLCVSMGIWFSQYRPQIERFVQQRFLPLLLGLAALYVGGGVLLMRVYDDYEYLYIPLPLLFLTVLIMVTMVWRFDNPVLQYFGSHLFSVFILMRLPMTVLEYYGVTEHVGLFIAISFAVTLPLAHVFDAALKKLDPALHLDRPRGAEESNQK